MLIIIIGLAMGILSGLAIGGGTLLVPALVILMDTKQHVAQGVTLAVFIPTAMVAVITHFRQGNIKLNVAGNLIIGSVLGALAGSLLASYLNAYFLRRIFGVFLIIMGIYEFICKPKIKE